MQLNPSEHSLGQCSVDFGIKLDHMQPNLQISSNKAQVMVSVMTVRVWLVPRVHLAAAALIDYAPQQGKNIELSNWISHTN